MLNFTKMQGIGNDYIYVDTWRQEIKDPAALAITLSERHFGIGGDGLIVLSPSDKADFRMDIYNADGSQAEMCGNGIRCAAKYFFDHGFSDKTELSCETLAGIRQLSLSLENGQVSSVRVDMGAPRLEAAQIPVLASGAPAEISLPSAADPPCYTALCISMGNPHAVIFLDEDIAALPLEQIGPPLEQDAIFPQRANIEFARLLDEQHIQMRVWERGSGETMACGTGACATTVAAIVRGYCRKDTDIQLQLRGGTLHICWDSASGHVLMSGPAQTVFEGVCYTV